MNRRVKNIIASAAAGVLAFSVVAGALTISKSQRKSSEKVKAGFVFDGDASTPYTANFIRAVSSLRNEYKDDIELVEKYNVPDDEADETIEQLAGQGCEIIFTNSYGYGESAKKAAKEHPDIQFCAATCDNANDDKLDNYHTFMGEIYQARYASGAVAGVKLKELIEQDKISEEQAVVGFVAAYPVAEVVSGYTAFLMGVRSQCESAVMKVKYINTWNNYALEKNAADQLISEGCVIISHHSNSIGSAIACENSNADHPVFHVGYNQDMSTVAPRTTLTGCRIDWSRYMLDAVEAVIENKKIENNVKGTVNGNDASGGFKEGWVKLFDVNNASAAKDSAKLAEEIRSDFEKGRVHVFKGDYTGKDINDSSDTCDLSSEYIENEKSSAPTFHYVLDKVITIV